MAVDAASILALAQVVRIGVNAWEAAQRGELTEEELDEAMAQIQDRVTGARSNWQASKRSPAAVARRDEEERPDG